VSQKLLVEDELPNSGAANALGSLPSWPEFAADERAAAITVLESAKVNYWTGADGRAFEQEFAEKVEVAHGIAVANGSVALGLALRALKLPRGSEIIVTPRTFIASVSEIILAGFRPVFADVDAESQNITLETIEPLINDSTSALLLVHLAGWPCDMEQIGQLADQHNLRVIEDCAQAHGARINGQSVGSWGDIAAFSFCQDKIMTTGGEGGMIVTNSKELWSQCWSSKDHGKNPAILETSSPGTVYKYVHDSVGTNLRMTEMQAAIGRVQLRKLDGWVKQRRINAAVLAKRFNAYGVLRVPQPMSDRVYHSFYKFYAFIRPECLRDGWSRDRIVSELIELGVPCGSGICPEVYREAAFTGLLNGSTGRLPVAAELGETSLMFPVHPTMSANNMHRIADFVATVLVRASR